MAPIVDQVIELLRQTPRTLRALLDDGRHPFTHSNYGPDTFSPFDVVGHLIHGEKTDWMPRVRTILEHGDTRTFEPFDRYAMYKECAGRPIGELLDEFEVLRTENLESLADLRLTEADLQRRGRHPALGTVTMRQLLATWTVHDLNHVAQIAKALSFQFREDVGPWLAYLSILRPSNPSD